ncbi:TIGR01212 family radical SAM protein [Roseburia hominis]
MLYYPYSEYLKNKYGEKVYKLPVNLPVTCPNRVNGDGCAFCAGAGAGFEAMEASVPVKEQLTCTRERIAGKYKAKKFIAYFQNYTNTYLPLEEFSRVLMEAATTPQVVEISVSTRPDCISREYLDVMQEVRAQTAVQMNVELGLQTANYHTLDQIQRGHGIAEFIDAVLKIRCCVGFSICAHVILNLPGDTMRDVVETARVLSALQVDMVKLHSLYIAKNTRLCDWYENGKISICSKEEYIERAISFLEEIPDTIAVERLFSRIPEEDAVFCNWGTSWWKLKDELLKKMEYENRRQGGKYHDLAGAALREADFIHAERSNEPKNL